MLRRTFCQLISSCLTLFNFNWFNQDEKPIEVLYPKSKTYEEWKTNGQDMRDYHNSYYIYLKGSERQLKEFMEVYYKYYFNQFETHSVVRDIIKRSNKDYSLGLCAIYCRKAEFNSTYDKTMRAFSYTLQTSNVKYVLVDDMPDLEQILKEYNQNYRKTFS